MDIWSRNKENGTMAWWNVPLSWDVTSTHISLLARSPSRPVKNGILMHCTWALSGREINHLEMAGRLEAKCEGGKRHGREVEK